MENKPVVKYVCKKRGTVLRDECRECPLWRKTKHVTRAQCFDNNVQEIVKDDE